jgi:hypothetical protein
MANWRDRVLREFPTQVARLTLVADPDGLLTEEGILTGLKERGFDLIPFEDPVEFRYAYESRYRAQWDRGAPTDLVVVLRSQARDLGTLPYDLCQAGRRIDFDLTDIFPNLSYPVVDALNRCHFDALFNAQQQYSPSRMGANQTKDFILLHVFEIEPKVIKDPAHLIHALLRLHCQRTDMPALFMARFIHVLGQVGQFADWPLDRIVPDRQAFFEFMQERWALFVRHGVTVDEQEVKDRPEVYGLKYPGPGLLPFDHHDVRVYLDNLFAEGLLTPVGPPADSSVTGTWLSVGLSLGDRGDASRRFDGLMTEISGCVPAETTPYQDWIAFAQKWGELQAVRYRLEDRLAPGHDAQIKDVGSRVDQSFCAWMLQRYAGLHNQPSDPPVMVHHITRMMAARIGSDHTAKLAFVLVDGMSIGQWCVIRDAARKAKSNLRFDEHAVFAWVPTLTSVSRQAAFAGKIPQYFPDSIQTTSKDDAGWRQFWMKQGVPACEIRFLGTVGDIGIDAIQKAANEDGCRVLGVVINTVDNIMHGMQLGMAGMHGQVEQWARQGALTKALAALVSHGWQVFVGSDHGNTEAIGVGSPSEGVLAETRGQRVRIYENETLRDKTASEVAHTCIWPPVGLPQGYYPLMASGCGAFATPGTTVVAHGGLSLEEVVVPFIRVYA